jgi:hypothetical protein
MVEEEYSDPVININIPESARLSEILWTDKIIYLRWVEAIELIV